MRLVCIKDRNTMRDVHMNPQQVSHIIVGKDVMDAEQHFLKWVHMTNGQVIETYADLENVLECIEKAHGARPKP